MYIKFLKDNRAIKVESHTKLYNSWKNFNTKG